MAETGQNTVNDKKNCSSSVRSRWGGLALPRLPRMSSRSQERLGPETRSRSRDLRNKISFWKRKSASITDYDPQYRVIYLGNVLTGWAKGDGCVDKPLSTLWRNHISSDKPDIMMKMTVVGSGLRAVTKEHGLTEYWANRITYCTAHPSYPRVFCWIYRHEGRKMKQELRCHAVLCPKEDKAKQIAGHLQDRLHQALVDFKKEKISRQNARLSLANSIHDNPSIPYRKLLLQSGTCNYKPPIERSKSAPKLTSIEEAEMEEDELLDSDEDEECIVNTNYNIAMLQVHRNPTIILDEVATYSSPSSVFREDNTDITLHEENTDDEEDEITDYIGSEEVISAASNSPSSQSRGTLSCSPEDIRHHHDVPGDSEDCHSLSDQSDSGHGLEDHGMISSSLGLIRISDQDTISDESGYSEDPGPSLGAKEVNVIKVNLSSETPASGQHEFVSEFESSVISGSHQQHKLEITLTDSPGDQQTERLVKRSNNWCRPINIEIDKLSDSVSQYDSQESSPRDTCSTDTCPTTESAPLTPTNISPLSLSPTQDDLERSSSPNLIISATSPRDGVTTPSPRVTDLTVKSVFLSEFSASEKLRYIDRSNVKNTKNNMMLNRQEFCINI